MSITTFQPQNVPAGTRFADIASMNDEQLHEEIRSLATLTAAAMCRLLLLIAELDRREAWNAWGIKSCAHWLSWQCGFSIGASREHVRVARALPDLHLVIDMFTRGELSYAKVRAITRVATPENQELLVEYAKRATAYQLERIVRHFRRHNELDDYNKAHEQREGRWIRTANDMHELTIKVTSEERAMLEAAEKEFEKDVPAGTSKRRRVADAYVLMAQAATSKEGKKSVVTNLNVSAETLSEDADGECNIDDQQIPPETARRLSCDAPVVVSLLDQDGVVLKKGRQTRLFTGPTRAAVLKRDKGTCIFPGCDQHKWIDVHHIHHWSKGGLSDPENGAVLCYFHHRLVHEGGFTLDHSFTFYRPDGTPVPKYATAPTFTPLQFDIDADGCLSSGNGESFDMDAAVGNLLEVTQAADALT